MSKRWRRLTDNEIKMAKLIFADSIDYAHVKIYQGIPCLPTMQVAVSPNGNIYFPRNNCPDDFTLASESHQIWMIHELTHVWQYQQGFKTWLGGLFLFVSGGYRRRRAYLYPKLSDICHFGMLNMEQQADLLAHYYASCYLKGNIYNAQNQTFQKILKSFIEDPCQKEWLPQCRFYRKNKRT